MKAKKNLVVIFFTVVGMYVLTACTGYIVATGPPPPPNEVIIVAPTPRHVWVPGYYTYRSGAYIWVEGRYQIPPRGKTTYVQGSWAKTPKGYKRGKGHWK